MIKIINFKALARLRCCDKAINYTRGYETGGEFHRGNPFDEVTDQIAKYLIN